MQALTRFFILALFAIVAFAATEGFAQSAKMPKANDPNIPQNFAYEAKITSCLNTPPSGSSISQQSWNDKITARLVFCLRGLVKESTKSLMTTLIDKYAMTVVSAALMLAAAVFGAKVMGGFMRNPKAEAVSFLFKIGVIMFVMTAHGFIIDFWFNAVDWFIELMAGASRAAFDSSSSAVCPSNPSGIGDWFIVWDKFDCLFGKFMGFGSTAAVGAGMVAIIGAVVFTYGLGIALAFAAFGAIIAMAQFLFRSAFMVLVAYIGIGLLLLMLPFFIVLILFKATESYMYQAWLRYIIGYVIQPAFTMAFLFFAVNVLSQIMVGGSTNVNGETIYTKYDAKTNSTSVTPPMKGPAPAGYVPALPTKDSILGLNPADSKQKQDEHMRGLYARGSFSNSAKINGDYTSDAYLLSQCGTAGMLKTGETTPKIDPTGCADPKKCLEAAKSNYAKSPSPNTAIAYKKALCEAAKKGAIAVNMGGTTAANSNSGNDIRLELNRVDARDGVVDPKIELATDSKSNAKIMQLVAYVATILITCGTFFHYIKDVPKLVQHLVGVPGQSMGIGFPKKLMDKIDQGMNNARKSWDQSLANAKKGGQVSTLQKAGGGAVVNFARGFMGQTYKAPKFEEKGKGVKNAYSKEAKSDEADTQPQPQPNTAPRTEAPIDQQRKDPETQKPRDDQEETLDLDKNPAHEREKASNVKKPTQQAREKVPEKIPAMQTNFYDEE